MIDTAVKENSALLDTPVVPNDRGEAATLSSVKTAGSTDTETALMVKREKWRSVVVLLAPVAFWAFVISITQVDVKATWALMLILFTASALVSKFAAPAPQFAGFWRRHIGLTTLYFGTVISGLVLCIPPHTF